MVLGTDQNFDLLKHDTHKHTATLFNNFVNNLFLPSITKPTRITDHSATLIDNIYVNNMSNKTTLHSAILIDDISDHFPIICILTSGLPNIEHDQTKFKCVERRNLTDEAIEITKVHLNRIDWNYLNHMTINEAYANFNNKINSILDITAPRRRVKLCSKNSIKDPWMTKELLNMSKNVAKMYSKCVGINKTEELYLLYMSKRNEYNYLKRTAKQLYYKNLFEKYKNDVKSAWRTINSIIGKDTDKSCITRAFNVEGSLITDSKEISDGFANFFEGIGREYANKIPKSQVTAENYIKTKQTSNKHSMYINATDPYEIEIILNKLKPKQSSGHDSITPMFLKKCMHQLAYPICLLVNMSIAESNVPSCL